MSLKHIENTGIDAHALQLKCVWIQTKQTQQYISKIF